MIVIISLTEMSTLVQIMYNKNVYYYCLYIGFNSHYPKMFYLRRIRKVFSRISFNFEVKTKGLIEKNDVVI